MTELAQLSTNVVAPTGLVSLGETVRYAELLANSGLLPKEYRRQPANVLFAVEYGRTLGITPIAAITGIHVIEGKPCASAGLMGALVRKAGHKLRVTGDNKSATAQIIRADDPDYVFKVTFTLDDAVNAGLCEIRNDRPYARSQKNGKVLPWEAYTRALLKARALSAVARDACEDVLFGLHYTPEELGAVIDQDGNPIEAAPSSYPAPQPAAEPRDYIAAAKAAAGADDTLRVYREAEAARAAVEVLEEIATIGRAKRAAEQEAITTDIAAAAAAHPAEPQKAPDPDSDDDTERQQLLTELRTLASAAGLSSADLEAGFRDSTGVDIVTSTPDQIRTVIGIFRGNAA